MNIIHYNKFLKIFYIKLLTNKNRSANIQAKIIKEVKTMKKFFKEWKEFVAKYGLNLRFW